MCHASCHKGWRPSNQCGTCDREPLSRPGRGRGSPQGNRVTCRSLSTACTRSIPRIVEKCQNLRYPLTAGWPYRRTGEPCSACLCGCCCRADSCTASRSCRNLEQLRVLPASVEHGNGQTSSVSVESGGLVFFSRGIVVVFMVVSWH